ncbi:MAG TPA: Gfo/Idh/MocA family oxidoreductase [Galbitalea sp.]|jgi:predicted dehydrogenase|nr:Gfo/Idh/MocA family oxidoreductase [Galbitalea sp.]
MAEIRIGILGAAGIAPGAIIRPALAVDGAVVVAVAARDVNDARQYAAENGIPKVHSGYEELLADPDIDVIYNPTPNGLHGKWTVAAVQSGKHVLAEKPFTANSDEARQVAAAVRETDRTVMEAFHYRYHPLMGRAIEIVKSGELGDLTSVESGFITAGRPRDDIRWNLALAGGGLMDVGCYPVHLLRSILGTEPTVRSATAIQGEPDVDGDMTIELEFPGGIAGRVRSSMMAKSNEVYATITGSDGVLEIANPFLPHNGSSITVRAGGSDRRETPTTEPSYNFQLRALIDVLNNGTPVLTGLDDAIANMVVIDAAYAAAGLGVRQPTR